MLANKINLDYQKQNTVIFVESTLFLLGICKILEYHMIKIKRISSFDDLYRIDQRNSIFICEVTKDEMEYKAKVALRYDQSVRIIIIKDNLILNEIESLIDIGIKGFMLSDLDESYLVNTVKQVHSGNLFIDHRFTNEIISKYKEYKRRQNQLTTINGDSFKTILTKREFEILTLLADGYSNNQLSQKLLISEKTVKNHVSNILAKMDVKDRLNAVIKALRNDWIRIDVY